jgi:hypothetical protein
MPVALKLAEGQLARAVATNPTSLTVPKGAKSPRASNADCESHQRPAPGETAQNGG